MPVIRAVLVDLSGTLHIGDKVIPGAIEAVQRLRDAGKRVRFLTNTSTKSSTSLLQQLNGLGFTIHPTELITSVLATREYLLRNNLRPYCILEDTSDLEDGIQLDSPHNCVVVGLAPSKLDYTHLNQAFRILLEHPKNLIAIHKANYLRDTDGELSLGPGGFCRGLEVAANCHAVVMGKPSKYFFESALSEISATETCMVGDDIFQDIQGAKEAGIGTTILVQTGKYRDGDEDMIEGPPTAVCKSFVEAVDYILQSK